MSQEPKIATAVETFSLPIYSYEDHAAVSLEYIFVARSYVEHAAAIHRSALAQRGGAELFTSQMFLEGSAFIKLSPHTANSKSCLRKDIDQIQVRERTVSYGIGAATVDLSSCERAPS